MKKKKETTDIFICSDRAGYGHIRGMLSVYDALNSAGHVADIGFVSKISSRFYQKAWQALDSSMGFFYSHLPQYFSKADNRVSTTFLLAMNKALSVLDLGMFEKYVKSKNYKLVIASHVTAAHLVKSKDLKVILLGLDPFPGLYFADGSNVITTAVDEETSIGLGKLGAKDIHVFGPKIPFPVTAARSKFDERQQELQSGKPLRIAIATGGSLTHGAEITELSKKFKKITSKVDVEKVYVIVGDSKPMKESVTQVIDNDERFEIIYDEDMVNLVRRADMAFADSDVIIGKTGELAFLVAGGKTFKTFHNNPSLGPQEVAIRQYVQNTSTVEDVSALEFGIDPDDEVRRILKQRESGRLAKMMRAGLRIPADGSLKVANMVTKMKNVEFKM